MNGMRGGGKVLLKVKKMCYSFVSPLYNNSEYNRRGLSNKKCILYSYYINHEFTPT